MAMRLCCSSGSWIALSIFRSGSRPYYCNPSLLSIFGFIGSSHSFLPFRQQFSVRLGERSKMTSPLIDVDCNLWHEDLKTLQSKDIADDDFWNILREDAIEEANIDSMLSPSSTIQQAKRGLERLKNSPPPLSIKTTVGVHPYHVNDLEFEGKSLVEHGDVIRTMIQSNADLCAAVGECGLDTSEGFPPLEDQVPWFQLQVEIAEELNLPLFVHERFAFEETMRILEKATVPIIIHCFTGNKEECTEYIKRGYYISVSGFILKESAQEVCECLREGVIPLDKLMIETDAPYMGFANCRDLYVKKNEIYASGLNAKKRKRLQQSIYPNVPSSLPMVLEKVAACLHQHDASITQDRVAEQTFLNAKTFFQFS